MFLPRRRVKTQTEHKWDTESTTLGCGKWLYKLGRLFILGLFWGEQPPFSFRQECGRRHFFVGLRGAPTWHPGGGEGDRLFNRSDELRWPLDRVGPTRHNVALTIASSRLVAHLAAFYLSYWSLGQRRLNSRFHRIVAVVSNVFRWN
jgi:hypothetical protein